MKQDSGLILSGFASNRFPTALRKRITQGVKNAEEKEAFQGRHLSSVSLQLAVQGSF